MKHKSCWSYASAGSPPAAPALTVRRLRRRRVVAVAVHRQLGQLRRRRFVDDVVARTFVCRRQCGCQARAATAAACAQVIYCVHHDTVRERLNFVKNVGNDIHLMIGITAFQKYTYGIHVQ